LSLVLYLAPDCPRHARMASSTLWKSRSAASSCMMPDRSSASSARIGSSRATGANGVAQNLRGREVDLHYAGGLKNDQPRLLGRGLQQRHHIAPERIGIEKRQGRLEADDHDV